MQCCLTVQPKQPPAAVLHLPCIGSIWLILVKELPAL